VRESEGIVRVCYFGAYDRHHRRNAILQRALALAGAEVLPCPAEPGETPGHLADLYRRMPDHDVILVGHPAASDIHLARELAGQRPVALDAALWPADAAAAEGAFHAADLVLLGTEAQIAHVSQALGIPRQHFARVFLGADDRLFRPPDSALEERGELRRVLACGESADPRERETLLAAATLLAGEPGPRFTLIGGGPASEAARELDSVDWMGDVPYELLPAAIVAADVCLGALAPEGEALRAIPERAFQALACGARLITADTPAVRELPPVGHALTLVPPADPSALAAAIRETCEVRTLLVREPGAAEFLPERMGRELLMRLALAKALR
jgi:glycosyltransferase involved in cell wall biosynthesis